MTTAIPTEPILIGGHSVYVKFFAMPRAADDPKRIEGTFTLVGAEGVLTLDALVGPQGIPGTPSPIIRPQWGSSVTDAGDLPNVATLEDADNGRAWYIDGSWHVYHENAYHIVSGSIPGPVGATPDISFTFEQIEANDPPVYGPIEVVETGTTLSPNFHVLVPAVPGPEGPAASLGLAADFDNSDLTVGNIIALKDDDPETYELIPPDFLAPQLYTIPHQNFVAHTGSEGRFLIASLNIPAKTFDWYPDVMGHIRLAKSGFLSSVQVEVEVRIGNTGVGTGEDQALCGLGPYDPTIGLLDSATIVHIMPHWSDTINPTMALSPETSGGRVDAGDAKTIYVFLHKISGTGSYNFTTDTAQLRIMVVPVVG